MEWISAEKLTEPGLYLLGSVAYPKAEKHVVIVTLRKTGWYVKYLRKGFGGCQLTALEHEPRFFGPIPKL